MYNFDGIIIFLSLAVTLARTQDNFYFDPHPGDHTAIEGQKVLLRCDVSNRNHIIFKWELNGKKVLNTSRRFQDDSDLQILSVDGSKDSGTFACIATNVTTGISVRSRGATLNIQWIEQTAQVELKLPREASEIALGSEVQLRCLCGGNPEPLVEWYHNGVRLTEKESATMRKNRLRLVRVTPEDNAVYSCSAHNEAGFAQSMDTNFILSVSGEGAAELNVDTFTKVALVKQGDVATFDCEYADALLTEWYFNDRLLTNGSDDGKFLVYDNGTLVINDARGPDVGGYKCVGISESGPVQAYLAQLVLAYLEDLSSDSFDPKLSDSDPVVIPVGGEYEVECSAPHGLPTPTLRWENTEGQPVLQDGRITSAENKLNLVDVQPIDSGNYSCVIENMAGRKSKSVWIMVSVTPLITKSPISERVHEGDKVTFSCEYSGTAYPVTEVTWRKEDQPLADSGPRINVNKATGVLTINRVQATDEGNYACVVTTAGHDPLLSLNAHLYVRKMLKFKPAPVDTKLELGTSTKIYCKADGQAQPSIYWLKDGEPELGRGVIDDDGTLTFDTVTRDHAGMYTCVATSDQGKINKTIEIEVVVKPWFKVSPKNTTAYDGHITMIHCLAEGEPIPFIKWDKNGQVDTIEANERFETLKNGSLLIKVTYMEDIGRYGCTAGSSAGFSRAEMYMHVENELSITQTKAMERYDMMKTIIIAVCAAVAYLAVVIGLTVYCSVRMVKLKAAQKNKRNTSEDAQAGNHKAENGSVPTERTELMEKRDNDTSVIKPILSDDTRSHASGVSSHNSSSHPSSSMRSASTYHKYSYPRCDLNTLGLLGKGIYGEVLLAKASQIRNGEIETLVVVKSLQSRDERDHFEFRREMEMFSKLNHEHIVKLLGVCRDMEPQFLITEYCEWGDLKQFLWAMRKDNGVNLQLNVPPLNHAQKMTICHQVAMGMEHLSNYRFIHKDLASRNVLLQPNLDVKISNLCLCRDVYASEYFPLHHNYLIPLRWMAPETVYTPEEYSTKSDVWSFGCFIYEVFSLGDVPYRHRTDEEVLTGLKTGDCVLDEIPPDCPPELWDIVQTCTADSVKDRPSFSEICIALSEITVDSDV